jgi:hypothetical protein
MHNPTSTGMSRVNNGLFIMLLLSNDTLPSHETRVVTRVVVVEAARGPGGSYRSVDNV